MDNLVDKILDGNSISTVEWIDINKTKPKLGEDVLIYRQGYGEHKNYYYDYVVASYIRNPYDKRRYCFVPVLQKKNTTPWIYTKVTHWMYLPTPPKPITLEEDQKGNTASGCLKEFYTHVKNN